MSEDPYGDIRRFVSKHTVDIRRWDLKGEDPTSKWSAARRLDIAAMFPMFTRKQLSTATLPPRRKGPLSEIGFSQAGEPCPSKGSHSRQTPS